MDLIFITKERKSEVVIVWLSFERRRQLVPCQLQRKRYHIFRNSQLMTTTLVFLFINGCDTSKKKRKSDNTRKFYSINYFSGLS